MVSAKKGELSNANEIRRKKRRRGCHAPIVCRALGSRERFRLGGSRTSVGKRTPPEPTLRRGFCLPLPGFTKPKRKTRHETCIRQTVRDPSPVGRCSRNRSRSRNQRTGHRFLRDLGGLPGGQLCLNRV